MNGAYRGQGSRRWRLPMTVGAAVLVVAGGVGAALASTGDGAGSAAAESIVCPDVAGQLPAIPARAQAEVERNLALLQTQINEANSRLISTKGQGGPNFVQNAILGPLEDKRISTIDRIAISIGRAAERPVGLEKLAPCALSTGEAAPAEPPAEQETTPPAEQETTPPAEDNEAGQFGTISCPDVESQLPAIPASAAAEVERNLALLQTQIDEANARLSRDGDQGGPNFVQNAILGPLEDKRVATVNRIATAIGRTAAKPVGLDALAPCALND